MLRVCSMKRPLVTGMGLFSSKRLPYTSCCKHNKEDTKPSVTNTKFWSDPVTWQRTRINTLRCLIGCTTGDFGTMWYLQMNYPTLSPITCTLSAMAAGITTSLILETILLRRSMRVPYNAAFKTAMGMSFVSMLAMELSENMVDWYLTGGKVMFDDPHFWLAAVVSAGAGYIVPLPYNYWRLRALGKSCH